MIEKRHIKNLRFSEAEYNFTVRKLFLPSALPGGRPNLQLLPAAQLRKIKPDILFAIMVRHALYVIPTQEMIQWLQKIIDGRNAIEICAGNDQIGHHLGIPMTDSFLQQNERVKQFMGALQQPVTDPGHNVLKYTANDAVTEFKPQVVIGSFVTQLGLIGENPLEVPGSAFGTDELKILRDPHVETYVMIGNRIVHANKRAFKIPHIEFEPDWLFTRGADQTQNCIWIWDKAAIPL